MTIIEEVKETEKRGRIKVASDRTTEDLSVIDGDILQKQLTPEG